MTTRPRALRIAEEHVAWALSQGMTPADIVASVSHEPGVTVSRQRAVWVVAAVWADLQVVTVAEEMKRRWRETGRRVA